MGVDLLALFTQGLWTRGGTVQRVTEVIAPVTVEVETDSVDILVEFIGQDEG